MLSRYLCNVILEFSRIWITTMKVALKHKALDRVPCELDPLFDKFLRALVKFCQECQLATIAEPP